MPTVQSVRPSTCPVHPDVRRRTLPTIQEDDAYDRADPIQEWALLSPSESSRVSADRIDALVTRIMSNRTSIQVEAHSDSAWSSVKDFARATADHLWSTTQSVARTAGSWLSRAWKGLKTSATAVTKAAYARWNRGPQADGVASDSLEYKRAPAHGTIGSPNRLSRSLSTQSDPGPRRSPLRRWSDARAQQRRRRHAFRRSLSDSFRDIASHQLGYELLTEVASGRNRLTLAAGEHTSQVQIAKPHRAVVEQPGSAARIAVGGWRVARSQHHAARTAFSVALTRKLILGHAAQQGTLRGEPRNTDFDFAFSEEDANRAIWLGRFCENKFRNLQGVPLSRGVRPRSA